MRLLKPAATLALFGMLGAQAQTPDSGPTMSQTVDFINKALTSRGGDGHTTGLAVISQDFTLENSCSLVLRSVDIFTIDAYRNNSLMSGQFISRRSLSLEHSDPLSVSTAKDGEWYEITIGKAVIEARYPDSASLPPPVVLPEEFVSFGKVQSVSDGDLHIATVYGKSVILHLQANPKVSQHTDTVDVPASVSDITQDSEISFAQTKVQDAPGEKKKGAFTHSEQVAVTHLEQVIVIYKKSSQPRPYPFLSFPDEDTAQRVAKALIHAMVLCNKPETPSLF
jgi:hypothetical protein